MMMGLWVPLIWLCCSAPGASAANRVVAKRVSANKPLADHLADFEQSLHAKDCTERHVSLVTGRARRIIDGCKFRFHADISASRIMDYLHGLRADTEDKRGISAQTFNLYIQAGGGEDQKPPNGFEPLTCGLQNRCSTD